VVRWVGRVGRRSLSVISLVCTLNINLLLKLREITFFGTPAKNNKPIETLPLSPKKVKQ